MNLAEAAASINREVRNRCRTYQVLNETLNPDDRVTMEAMIADRDVTSVMISQALRMIGVYLPPPSLARHRRGDCKCGLPPI